MSPRDSFKVIKLNIPTWYFCELGHGAQFIRFLVSIIVFIYENRSLIRQTLTQYMSIVSIILIDTNTVSMKSAFNFKIIFDFILLFISDKLDFRLRVPLPLRIVSIVRQTEPCILCFGLNKP